MSIVTKQRYGFLLLIILSFVKYKSQSTPYLERKVNLNESKQLVSNVFQKITAQTGVVFSYSQMFNDKQTINISCKNKPLRLVLSEIIQTANCYYQIKGKFIIIKCNNKPVIPPALLNGYIYNIQDSSGISNASIYIKETKQANITNEFGYFSLSYSNKLPLLAVSVAKENFKDTTLVIYNKVKQEITIYLNPSVQKIDTVKNKISVPKDSIIMKASDTVSLTQEKPPVFRKWFKKFNTNFKNIRDTLFTKVSFSLIPYLSTNRLLSINTVNKFSFNLIAGYSKGIDLMEIGTVLNFSDGNVRYLQLAGVGNIVAGNFLGLQMAGVTNINSKQTTGLQMAGIGNINRGDLTGLQMASVFNITQGKVYGSQLSGVSNQAQIVQGLQMASVLNLTTKEMNGAQLSGVVNISRGKLNGLQAAGVYNQADTLLGFQVSGFLNRATYLKGTQLSVFNYNDTASGIPIGFFSFVRKGYHKFELASDELNFATLSFGTGVNKFHNIFITGINYAKPDLWTYGYGVGSTFKIAPKWNLSMSLSAQQIQLTSKDNISTNILSKYYLGLEFVPKSKFIIGMGPTFSVYNSDISSINYNSKFEKISPYNLYNQTTGNINTKIWIGAKLYLKIF